MMPVGLSYDKARLCTEEKLGKKIETTHVESVAEGADASELFVS